MKIIDKYYNGVECRIIGVGHMTKGEDRNLIKDFPYRDKDIPHIGLVHAHGRFSF